MNSPSTSSTVAIIGGGVSGCLVALQLLRLARAPLRVLLFERMTDLGRGVAYSTENPEHRLNVPAGKMSAFPDDPGHFLRWVQLRAGQPGYPSSVAAGDFLPRWIFGTYVRAALDEAVESAGSGVELAVIKGEAIDIEEMPEGRRVHCGGGRVFAADRVVLAIGNLPGEYPIRSPLPAYHSMRYVHVPWQRGTLAGIPSRAEVLVIGAGLTAIDIVLELESKGHTGTIHALSRHGMLPQVHQPSPPYPGFLEGQALPTTILALFRRLRTEVRKAAAIRVDWRTVLDAIRPQAQALWQGFSWDERARFMRHVRPFWEVHRHRLAPTVAAKIEALRAAGRLQFHAGRLTRLVEKPDGAEAQFRERRSGVLRTVSVAKAINCTGPRSDYSKYQHPLLINLLSRGLIDHDPLALGIHALPDGQVLRYRGGPVGWLYTLGAPLKGALWECTAIPEIRAQAIRLAECLIRTWTQEEALTQSDPLPA